MYLGRKKKTKRSSKMSKHSGEMSARFFDLKVGIRELSFLFMQEQLRSSHFKKCHYSAESL